MRFQAVGCSDAGRVKKTNQDSFLIEIADTSLEDVALVAVADGMGGLSKGELASATVVRRLSSWFEEKLPLSLEALDSSVEGFQQFVEGQWAGFVQDLNLEIMRYGLEKTYGLGTTLTAMLATGARYSFVHVGDSRLYEITDKTITQLTEDQTFVNKEIKAGRLSKEEGEKHPRRNVLLQCIGSSKEVRPEVKHGNVNVNATYLLCSDGFRHVISEEELQKGFCPSVLNWADENAANYVVRSLRQFVDLAMSRKESDNITAVLMHVEGK